MRLDELVVTNLGVIEDARIEPHRGLTVVTGETGTGKTLLLGALVALLGGGLRTDRIGPNGDTLTVAARFVDGDDEHVARLSLRRGGRTRAYLDGAPATAAEVAEATARLVDVVAQHDALRLRRSSTVRALVDASLDVEGVACRRAHEEAWDRLEAARAARDALGGDGRSLLRERDTLRREATDIAAVAPGVDEDVELHATIERLRNSQDLAELGATVEAAALDVGESVGILVDAARRIDRLDPTAGLADTAERVAAESAELLAASRHYRDQLTHDPDELDRLATRQARLGELKRRFAPDLGSVLAHAEAATARADAIDELLGRAEGLDAEVTDAEAAAVATARALSHARRMAASTLAERTTTHLRSLGFTDPVVVCDLEDQPLGASGADRLELRFSSDRRLPPQPVGTTASGGELSRLVLALRLAGGLEDVPVVVFDEIDAGVGGVTALALAERLATVAATSQVLCVTHLPQVAAFADLHLVVTRDGPRAAVAAVDGEARVAELTRMLSGLPDSDPGREHAHELLARAGRPVG